MDAEEDVKDFRPPRPGLDPPEIVVLFLCPERAFHRSRPHSGKLLSDKVYFLQMGRYGEFSEQACRNNFENGTFDWFAFNEHLIRKTLTGKFLTIAVNPCFLPKSGKKTSWIGRFWSGVEGEMKLGQEVSGVGVIDVDNRDCMTLSAIQTPDTKSLE